MDGLLRSVADPFRPRPHLVLIGAGTAHLALLAGKRMGRWLTDVDVTLVNATSTVPYTGMLPACLAGECSREAITIELPSVCRRAGVRLILGMAEQIDRATGAVRVSGRATPLRFDALAIAPGSTTRGVPGDAVPVRPLDGLLDAVDRWIREERRTVAVVGAGAFGAEIAMALAGRGFSVTLFERGPRILPEMAERVGKRFARYLRSGAVVVRVDTEVHTFQEGQLRIAGGSEPFDACVWATGPMAPHWLETQRQSLALNEEGFLRVDATLRVLDTENVFATGDGIAIEGQRARRNGVAAVHQSRVLGQNVDRLFSKKPLVPFRLNRPTLWILNAGRGRGVAGFGVLSLGGSVPRRLKTWLDARWMERWGRPAPTATDMLCDGCGGKASAQVLESVIGPLDWEDGGFWQAQGTPLGGSLDALTSWTDDGEAFASIAVLHGLSDVYAKGIRPEAALLSVTLPRLPSPALERILEEVDRGARNTLEREGVRLVAGHTAQADRLALTVAVIGTVRAETPPFRKNALERGAVLMLTKPLGTGIVLAAMAQGGCPAATVLECDRWMRQSNGPGAAIARTYGVRAATDVTGFGLAVTALDMARFSGVALEFALEFPTFPGVLDLYRSSLRPSLWDANRRRALELGAPATLPAVAFDPQTSGGLLVALPPERWQRFAAETGAFPVAFVR